METTIVLRAGVLGFRLQGLGQGDLVAKDLGITGYYMASRNVRSPRDPPSRVGEAWSSRPPISV